MCTFGVERGLESIVAGGSSAGLLTTLSFLFLMNMDAPILYDHDLDSP